VTDDMTHDPRLHYDRKDLELVQETSPEDFREWVIQKIGGLGGLPRDLVDRLPDPRVELAPLLDAMIAGDSLWLCRTKKMAPLYGNEGIALVRDGRPIIYLRAYNY